LAMNGEHGPHDPHVEVSSLVHLDLSMGDRQPRVAYHSNQGGGQLGFGRVHGCDSWNHKHLKYGTVAWVPKRRR
jgi:hypothetical protein